MPPKHSVRQWYTMLYLHIILAIVVPFSLGHSWVERLMRIDHHGTMVGKPGYIRGTISRTSIGFSDLSSNANMTATCSHWLWYNAGRMPTISVSNRLTAICDDLPQQRTSPSLVVTIADKGGQLFQNSRKGSKYICLDYYKDDPNPLMVARCGLVPQKSCKYSCCSAEKDCRPARSKTLSELHNTVFAELFYPFADVFCYYCHDEGDFLNCTRQLTTFLKDARPDVRQGHMPRLLIVLDWGDPKSAEQRLNAAIEQATTCSPMHYFSRVLVIKPANMDNFPIRQVLAQQAGLAREQRRRQDRVFSP